MSNLISAVAWVRRGIAVQHPAKYVLDDDELEDARVELERAQKAAQAIEKRKEEDEAETDAKEKGEDRDEGGGIFSNIKGLTYYRNNEEDTYITLKDVWEDEDNERAELEILPTDNLIVTAKTEDEISQLEIYVYDESEENLYVHHDLMLPNFPLSLEWLDFPPVAISASSETGNPATPGFGNYNAVGTLDPEIEIWSLGVLDAMQKETKQRAGEKRYHVDAVLSLSWNKSQRNLHASADRTVKLWDLTTGGAIRSFDVHKYKVQVVQWNAAEPSVLLTGSYDRTVRTFDSRAPTGGVGAAVGSDVEALQWDPWENYGFYVPAPARFTLSAHDGATSALDVNTHIPGCIITGGMDKQVKIWNITDEASSVTGKRNVSLVTSRDLGVGKVFSAVFSPDDPLTVAAAGSKAKIQVWDVGANGGARRVFSLQTRAKL
ncbi:WD40-repeat-containing domain protein [Amanita rubescens]|nr:WD40-repeat-containing domain protein [Amanita rubescens]